MKMKKILIMDDDVAVTNYLKVFLTQTGLFSIVVVNDSNEVAGLLDREAFDIILLDMDMPNVSGMDILRDMHSKGMDAPVVVLTGVGDATEANTSTRYYPDHEGIYRKFGSGEVGVQGLRVVRNSFLQSSSLTAASGWTETNCTVTGGQTDPFGGSTASRIQGTAGSWILFRNVSDVAGELPASGTYNWTISGYVKSNTGSDQTFKLFGEGNGRTLGKALLVVLRQSHVPLLVNRVVKALVADKGYCHGRVVEIGVPEDSVEAHGPASAPPPNADPFGIEEGPFLEKGAGCCGLVG